MNHYMVNISEWFWLYHWSQASTFLSQLLPLKTQFAASQVSDCAGHGCCLGLFSDDSLQYVVRSAMGCCQMRDRASHSDVFHLKCKSAQSLACVYLGHLRVYILRINRM
jgi:hypothetical protein